MSKIVQDVRKLRTPVTELPKNKAEQDVLGAALLTQLKNHKGLGLSANQIGVNKRVRVVGIKEAEELGARRIIRDRAGADAFVEKVARESGASKQSVKRSIMSGEFDQMIFEEQVRRRRPKRPQLRRNDIPFNKSKTDRKRKTVKRTETKRTL